MVYLFLTDKCEMIEALTPVDMLRRAEISVTTVSVTGNITVKSSHDVLITADMLFEDCDFENMTAVILPGGPGVPSLISHKPLCDLVRRNYDKGNLTAAICGAPTLLTAIGLTEATAAHPSVAEKVANYSAERVCLEGNVLTAAAMGCSAEFSSAIIKYLKGEGSAKKIENSILL